MRIFLSILVVFFTSCVKADPNGFGKGTLTISGKTLNIEIADTDSKRGRGLMFRKEIADDAGMLFIFQDNEVRSFWMKNTFIPLSIGYFDKDKKLIEIFDMTPVKSEMQLDVPTYPGTKPAMYALEVTKGWFHKNGIKPGATFSFKKH